ncbi:hypothetical protein [Litorimonas sp.]|uniref:hypothetical protein n=1 Tax=Litorimonas sp. TaxID=1892381 RepID=UPI003A8656E0
MFYKNVSLFALAAALSVSALSACGDNPSDQTGDEETPVSQSQMEEDALPATDGRIVVSSLPKVDEPNTCILPITITNGTESEATVSMMSFSVTGSGQEDSGNMFAQAVAPGETNTARLLFPARKCEELSVITAPNLTCKTEGEDCVDAVEFEAVDGLIIQRGE